MSQDELENLLRDIKSGLAELYGDRLYAVFLYGSYARGDQDAESDLDILIVLKDYARYSAEIEYTGELISDLSLKYGLSISRKFITENDWVNMDSALLRNVRAESIAT